MVGTQNLAMVLSIVAQIAFGRRVGKIGITTRLAEKEFGRWSVRGAFKTQNHSGRDSARCVNLKGDGSLIGEPDRDAGQVHAQAVRTVVA